MSTSRRLFQLGLFRRRTARAKMSEELAFHLEARVQQLVARGMSPDDARQEALRRLGGSIANTERHLGDSAERKERRLDMRERVHEFLDDVRYAVRGLMRNPGFAVIAILTLAIGIGANTSIYSAVDALLLRSLPFGDPAQLMDIVQWTDVRAGEDGAVAWSYPKFGFFRDQQRSFSSVAAYVPMQTIVTGNEPERIGGEQVTAAYLTTLGVHVAHGRNFPVELDAAPGSRKVAIISDALWQRRFNADPNVAGKTLDLNNETWEIAGVLPPGFRGLSGRADVLTNVTARPAQDLSQTWPLEFSVIGHRKLGVTAEQAETEARAIGSRIYAAFPIQKGTLTTNARLDKWTAVARPLNTIRVAPALRRSLLVLFGAVAMVLLIACVNLANLILARAVSRKREIAVRLAIGAGRGRLVRLLLTESLVLGAAGGVVSLAIARIGTSVLSTINPQEALQAQRLSGAVGAVGFESIRLDGRALAFTFAVSMVVAVMFGLVPALRASRANLASDLKDGSARAGTGRRIGVSRRALVVAEIALALVLLAGSGLMIRSLGNLLNVNPGFDGTNVLTLRLSVPAGVVAPDSMPGFYDELQREIAGLPGVRQVALADCAPLSNACGGTIMTFADRPVSATNNAMVGVHWVSPSWLGTLRVPLKRGRAFTDADQLATGKVVMINEAAARKFFPGEDPIGKRVAVFQGGFNTGAEVIGIVGDVRYGTIDSTARPDAYISYGQSRVSRMMIFVRTDGDPSAIAPAVRALIRRIAPRDPVYDIRPMSSRIASASGQARFSAIVLAMFGAVALTLAAMGIYGVISFGVAQRTHEIGIRVALGADRGRVVSLVLREGAWMAAVGALLGFAAALALTRVLRTALFEVATTDPPTYIAIGIVVASVVTVASWIPARRAARVDPIIALRRG